MRNSNTSHSSKQQSHPQQLMMSPGVFNADGSYDFIHSRSSESTEPAKSVSSSKTATATSFATNTSMTVAPFAYGAGAGANAGAGADQDIDSRGVPISPKQMPPTPPRDLGSPYNPFSNRIRNRAQATVNAGPPAVPQPYLSSPQEPNSVLNRCSRVILRPSTTAMLTQARPGISHIFRPSSRSPQYGSNFAASRKEEGFYTIYRCDAFDKDDESDDEDDGYVSRMAEF